MSDWKPDKLIKTPEGGRDTFSWDEASVTL